MTLNGLLRVVFSKTAVLQRTSAGFRYAGRHASPFGCRRELCSVSRWGASEVAAEGRRERAHTVESNTHANVCDLAICVAKKCRCSFQAACQQVMVRRLAKCPTELATEMGRRQAGSSSKDRNAEWLEVSTVHHSFRTEQVSGARDGDHILGNPENRRGLAAAACSSSSSLPRPGTAASAPPPRLAHLPSSCPPWSSTHPGRLCSPDRQQRRHRPRHQPHRSQSRPSAIRRSGQPTQHGAKRPLGQLDRGRESRHCSRRGGTTAVEHARLRHQPMADHLRSANTTHATSSQLRARS